ncbi:MAG: PAS domain-containing protein [Bradyrhizobium sp.]
MPTDLQGALLEQTSKVARQEQQSLDILEHCPAGLNVIDEDGRLLLYNARIRQLFGYDKDELYLFDTRKFWNDLGHRARIIEKLRNREGEVLNEDAVWKTKPRLLRKLLTK